MPTSQSSNGERPYVLDVSRLIWRIWTRRLPTGIDRVCIAYLDHYGPNALAFIQYAERRFVLNETFSDKLFELLRSDTKRFRTGLVCLLAMAIAASPRPITAGKFYLNIGHTGLNAKGLESWLRQNGLRPIFLIHDLIPITHPEYCRDGEAERHTARIRTALSCAEGIIANSADTLRALFEFCETNSMPMPEYLVSWLGVDSIQQKSKYKIHKSPYFACIGTIEARKNHILILHVWEILVRKLGSLAPTLVIIGQRGWDANEAFALLDKTGHFNGHVVELGRCSDDITTSILEDARALLMPSFVEGFGIPVIEALGKGVPVIASNLDVFREIAGDIPLYIDPLDGKHWEDAISAYSSTCADRDRQIQEMNSFQVPSWKKHFLKVDAWLNLL